MNKTFTLTNNCLIVLFKNLESSNFEIKFIKEQPINIRI